MNWNKLIKNLIDNINLLDAQENSFKNYHSEGLNYLCLSRTPELTIKIYFIDRDIKTENHKYNTIVNPHSHGYNFDTILVSGEIENIVFDYSPTALVEDEPQLFHKHMVYHNRFDYISALKNENLNGFKFKDSGVLNVSEMSHYTTLGSSYYTDHTQIHSLKKRGVEETVLLLFQYADIDKPSTEFFIQSKELIKNTNLYKKFTVQEIKNLVNKLDYLCMKKEYVKVNTI